MSRVVNVHEAKTHLSRLLEAVERGEEIVVARAGKPVAKLVAIAPPEPVPMGFVKGIIMDSFFEPLSDEELALWEGREGDD